MPRTAALALTTLVAAAAVAAVPTSARTWTPDDGGGFVSGPVEHLTTVPLEAGGASDAVRTGDLLVVSSFRSFSIYDLADPVQPELLSTTPLGPALYNERPRTNGEILLLSNDSGLNDTLRPRLDVYDITDPASPVRVGRYESVRRDHIWTCVLDCAYAYSASGTVLDLSDPTNPTRVGDLMGQVSYTDMHVVEEVADGIVILGSNPAYVLDARHDPVRPDVLAIVHAPTTTPDSPLMPRSIPARVDWPAGDDPGADVLRRDRLTVLSMETPFTGRCTDQSGSVLSFATGDWRETGTWQHVDTFQITSNGTYTDGAPPYNVFGCGAYGMDLHPDWGDLSGRRAAVTFFEHGLRVLDVGDDGSITEVGGWLPVAGNAVTPVWVTTDVLYVLDNNRGMDILRVTD